VLHKPFSQSNAFSDRKIKNLNYKRNEEKSNKIQIIREKKEISKYVNSVEDDIEDADAVKEVKRSLRMLINNLEGAKLDSLILLIVTAAVIPICKRLNTSPIIGFLLMGTLTGPNWLNWIRAHNVHVIDVIGDLGIVFFLFEMGLELSLERLNAMKRDVFYLGTSQFLGTAAAGTALSKFFGLPTRAAVTIGGSLALSSSAFVLQLLKDQNNMGTRYGRVSFGILLLQDLAVVPLLVIVDILSSGGTGLWKALGVAGMKAMITLTSMTILGKSVLDKVFNYVAKSRSQEAFLGIILSSVLFMSFITEGIGLSNTLGAFLAGLLLSETKYRYQIESDIAPFRGLLLGIFFMTVGFNIDPKLMLKKGGKIFGLLAMMIAGKTAITTAICRLSGIAPVDAIQCGLMTSQGSELAFVALGIAERGSLLSPELTKILLTTVALSMAITPALDSLGHYIGNRIEQNQGNRENRSICSSRRK
jgi:monovalent cation:proton antiporter-2 (CPA2) family protein